MHFAYANVSNPLPLGIYWILTTTCTVEETEDRQDGRLARGHLMKCLVLLMLSDRASAGRSPCKPRPCRADTKARTRCSVVTVHRIDTEMSLRHPSSRRRFLAHTDAFSTHHSVVYTGPARVNSCSPGARCWCLKEVPPRRTLGLQGRWHLAETLGCLAGVPPQSSHVSRLPFSFQPCHHHQ